mmetsp:Transcript_58818/g.161427  ORF Transcript_58818/g.161427 Transcript_58818/m.161427 type:complete len:266 (+) Transcript_58818:667-1464(+)
MGARALPAQRRHHVRVDARRRAGQATAGRRGCNLDAISRRAVAALPRAGGEGRPDPVHRRRVRGGARRRLPPALRHRRAGAARESRAAALCRPHGRHLVRRARVLPAVGLLVRRRGRARQPRAGGGDRQAAGADGRAAALRGGAGRGVAAAQGGRYGCLHAGIGARALAGGRARRPGKLVSASAAVAFVETETALLLSGGGLRRLGLPACRSFRCGTYWLCVGLLAATGKRCTHLNAAGRRAEGRTCKYITVVLACVGATESDER